MKILTVVGCGECGQFFLFSFAVFSNFHWVHSMLMMVTLHTKLLLSGDYYKEHRENLKVFYCNYTGNTRTAILNTRFDTVVIYKPVHSNKNKQDIKEHIYLWMVGTWIIFPPLLCYFPSVS